MSITSASPSSQSISSSVMQTLQLQSAQRYAEQARQAARNLQSEAASANAAADQADQRARALAGDAQQAQAAAAQADQNLATAQSGLRVQSQVGQLAQSVHQATQTLKGPVPVVNSLGQTTGKVVNLKV